MTSILKLLEAKHDKDIWVPECSMGPSGSRRLDGWAMKRTWSPVTMIGYEIKTARGDFLRDEKWPNYLEACHHLYFVCPRGLIQPAELPESVGLLWTTKNGTKLYTKRKAPRREIEFPENLATYVLMSRTEIVADMWRANAKDNTRASRTAKWRRWLEDKKESGDIGRQVTAELQRKVAGIEGENIRLKNVNASLGKVAEVVRELGMDPQVPVRDWQVRSRLQEVLSGLPPDLSADLANCRATLSRALRSVTDAEELARNFDASEGAA